MTCTDVDDVRLPMTLAAKSSRLDLSSSRKQLKARVGSGYTCIEMKDAVPAETLSQAAGVIDCHRLSLHYNSTAATTVITTGTGSIVTTALHYSNSCQHYSQRQHYTSNYQHCRNTRESATKHYKSGDDDDSGDDKANVIHRVSGTRQASLQTPGHLTCGDSQTCDHKQGGNKS